MTSTPCSARRPLATSHNGTAMTSAEFDGITGLAVDSAGDLYIADSGNSRVLEVPVSSGTKWGAISETANEIFTVAGNGHRRAHR